MDALQAALRRVGFTERAVETLTDPDGEGITLEVLASLDDDDVHTMCQAMRKAKVEGNAGRGRGAGAAGQVGAGVSTLA